MKRKKRYNFYYDESFHDRKITEKNGELNIENENLSDTFVTAVIGFAEHRTTIYEEEFLGFEANARALLSLAPDKEFKGRTIKASNFSKGVASFNKNTLNIYEYFFDLLDDPQLLIQLSLLSKFEFFVIQLLSVALPKYAAKKETIYSFVKFLNQYKNKALIDVLFSEDTTPESAIAHIEKLLKEVLQKIRGIERKEIEEQMIKDMLRILSDSQFTIYITEKIFWDYSKALDGLTFFLEEMNIKQQAVALYIDEEKNTCEAAQQFHFKKVEPVKSEECICVRYADFLANFVGRMIYYISEEYLEDWDQTQTKETLAEKRILSEAWFDLSEKKFNLYKKIAKVFYAREDIYWTIQTGIYGDKASLFFSLLYYISKEHEDYAVFQTILPAAHRERFNTYSVQRGQGHLEHPVRLSMKKRT